MNSGSMSKFFALVKDFRRVQSLVLKGAVLFPLAFIWTKLGPPNSDITNAFLSIIELVVLISVFQLGYGKSAVSLKKVSIACAVLFTVFALGSVYFWQVFTLPVNDSRSHVIIGTRLQDDVAKLGPTYSPSDALRDSEYDPTKVWTAGSIHIITLLFELDWLLTLVMFMVTVVTFTMSQTE